MGWRTKNVVKQNDWHTTSSMQILAISNSGESGDYKRTLINLFEIN